MDRGWNLSSLRSLAVLIQALDYVGTFAFAVTGAIAAIRHRFDIFGVLALAFVTAVAGGITRDILIGSIPPAAFSTWHYLALSLLAGVLSFVFHDRLSGFAHPVQIFDAAGLATFAVVGTNKALAYGLDWPMAAILGMVSGIGGGMLRDVLTIKAPIVLRTEIYAVAALAGSLVVAVGSLVRLPNETLTLIGAALCFTLRLVGIHRKWKLPSIR